MSKPMICSEEWDEAFPEKWSVVRVDGRNPWIVFPPYRQPDSPSEKIARFGSHEAAVRHLVKKGW